MAPKTLYDVIRPICWRLNMFGYNYGNEKPEGWIRRGCKWALKCLLLYSIWRILLHDCISVNTYSPIGLALLSWQLLQISSFCLQFFFVKEGEIQELIERLKQHPVGKMSQKNLNKQLIPFKIYSAIFVIYFLSFISLDPVNSDVSFPRAVFGFLQSEYAILIMQFPYLLCILPCIVTCYCRTEMDEAIEEMKRIKSPLRRAKARAKLIEKYQQLTELASVTDRALSAAIYFMKWIFFISFAAVILANAMLIKRIANVNLNKKVSDIIMNYIIALVIITLILMCFPLLQYFYLAPSANQMFERMNRTIVDCGSIDDQWLSRDPIARPYLLKMRMEVVERVSHMATEDPPFTLFGDVLDNDIKFAVILELIDMCNTLDVHESQDEMTPSRILSNFMIRCVDCEYMYWWKYT